MSHVYRFLGFPGEPGSGTWLLGADETLHLAKVLRIVEGETVEVTDGAGRWVTGTVASISGKQVVIGVVGAVVEEPVPAWPLRVAIGALRPGVLDEILPAIVELGADEIWVFNQQDNAKTRMADKVIDRWQRILVAAIKQSKRSRLPVLSTCESVRELVAGAGEAGSGGSDAVRRLVLDPAGAGTLLAALTAAPVGPGGVLLVVGGEKGFSTDEAHTLQRAGFVGVRLGGFVLRAVTAVVSACSLATAVRGEAR
jgi:16S rRNA (uracil1498-N3)-methyltransferase